MLRPGGSKVTFCILANLSFFVGFYFSSFSWVPSCPASFCGRPHKVGYCRLLLTRPLPLLCPASPMPHQTSEERSKFVSTAYLHFNFSSTICSGRKQSKPRSFVISSLQRASDGWRSGSIQKICPHILLYIPLNIHMSLYPPVTGFSAASKKVGDG